MEEVYHFDSKQGFRVPPWPVAHRDDEYSESGFSQLIDMQQRHFWYRGRHRFLLAVVRRLLKDRSGETLSACDFGGGCGGWIQYLQSHAPKQFAELALTDSSSRALALASSVVGADVHRYQTDLLNLGWDNRWDVAFLLDVLEHIPQDEQAMRSIHRSLKPGGLLFVTTPAFQRFWTFNDDAVGHQRRYVKSCFQNLARNVGFEMELARYFMFFLSPLLILSRKAGGDRSHLSQGEVEEQLRRSHRVPSAPVNETLAAVFGAETPLGIHIPFPWGTSILGVFRKK